MKNIVDILKGIGIEVPEDKLEDFNSEVAKNYKTIAEYDKKVQRLESDRDAYKEQLDTANNTLKGFEGVDVATMNQQIADWKKKAEDAEKDYQQKISERDFNDALNSAMEAYTFTSTAAKEAVMNQVRKAGLKSMDGKILGLGDLMEQIKEKDAGAFAVQKEKPAKFTSSIGGQTGGKTYASKAEIMKIKDPVERQNAIENNLELFVQE